MSNLPAVDLIPHRPPFLFVDRVLESEDRRIVTTYVVDRDADFFRGHYPSWPIMPGVLLCECCFQAGALLLSARRGEYRETDGVPILTRIQDARFKKMVEPGQTVQVEVTLDDTMEGVFYMTGRATVDGQLAMRVGFICMLAAPKGESK